MCMKEGKLKLIFKLAQRRNHLLCTSDNGSPLIELLVVCFSSASNCPRRHQWKMAKIDVSYREYIILFEYKCFSFWNFSNTTFVVKRRSVWEIFTINMCLTSGKDTFVTHRMYIPYVYGAPLKRTAYLRTRLPNDKQHYNIKRFSV